LKVCVVGAGFAGLAAADMLNDAGQDVIVLEARGRVGGRVWSQRLSNGAIIERGAEYLEMEQDTLISTAARLGLRLAPAGVSFNDREPHGGLQTSSEEIRSAIFTIRRTLAEHPEYCFELSAAQVLDKVPGIRIAAKEAIASRVQITSCRPADQLSAYDLIYVSFSSVEGLRIAEGNQSIALRFAERLGERVRLEQPVNKITWSSKCVRVFHKSGVIDADACIVAVPVAVISNIEFDPKLPQWKTDALEHVALGYAAKLFIPLRSTPKPSAVLSVRDHYWTYTAKGANGEVQRLVSAFAGSSEALEELPDKRRIRILDQKDSRTTAGSRA
jgi:monoamine oxidase